MKCIFTLMLVASQFFMLAQVCPGEGGVGTVGWTATDPGQFFLDFPTSTDADLVLNNGSTIIVKGCAGDGNGGSFGCTMNLLSDFRSVSDFQIATGASDRIIPVSSTLWNNTGGGTASAPFSGELYIEFANGQLLECAYSNGNLLFTSLPIDLLSFDVVKGRDGIVVKWETLSEINADYFALEYSADGEHFSQLEIIETRGSATRGESYKTVLSNPVSGVSYYRLQMVDIDGQYTYSDTKAINLEQTAPRSLLAPTVIDEGGYVQLDLRNWPVDREISIIATTMSGVSVELTNQLGGTIATIPTAILSSGIHVITATDGVQSVVNKLVIR